MTVVFGFDEDPAEKDGHAEPNNEPYEISAYVFSVLLWLLPDLVNPLLVERIIALQHKKVRL